MFRTACGASSRDTDAILLEKNHLLELENEQLHHRAALLPSRVSTRHSCTELYLVRTLARIEAMANMASETATMSELVFLAKRTA